MADAMVEQRPTVRFFCHSCSIEFEDVLQDYTCPYCASGFIEQLDGDSQGVSSDFSDADMSSIEDLGTMEEITFVNDSDSTRQGATPVLNDLAFLMSGGRSRGAGLRETIMEQLVWMIGGGRPGTGATTAGAPFVLVGAPGDYVFGGEGLDAVVTQLLGQLENTGPPPLPQEQIAAIPTEAVTEQQAATSTACSICWDNFSLGENISRLQCEHTFHATCIEPWLQLHATCPICRRSLLPAPPAPHAPPSAAAPPASAARPRPILRSNSSVVLRFPASAGRRVVRRRGSGREAAGGSAAGAAGVSVWALASAPSSSASASASADSDDHTSHYNLDIDYD